MSQTPVYLARRHYLAAFLIGFLFIAFGALWTLALGQDSAIIVAPPGEGEVPNVLSIQELVAWGAGIVGAFLIKKWNVAQGKLDGINNFLKAFVATLLVAAIGGVARFFGAEATGTGFDLTQTGITSVLQGIGTTVLVWLGISTAKAKAVAPVKPVSSSGFDA